MESQQNRLITVLSVLVLALVGFLVFVKPPEEKEDNAVEWSKAFPDAAAADVNHVELKLGSRSLTFEHKDGAWTVSDGGAPLPADGQKVRSLVDDVVGVETGAAVPDSAGHLADFGLDTPTAIVTLTATTPLVLRVGKDTPVGYGTYVQVGEGGPVVRARTKLSGAVLGGGDGSLSDFRDKALFRWNPADLSALRIDRAPQSPCPAEPCAPVSVSLVKDSHGWWIDGVPRQRANQDTLESMLAALTGMSADGFTPDMGGTLSPDITLTLTIAGAPQVVEIASEDEGVRLVRAPGVPDLARVKGALHEGFTQDPASWLDDRIMPLHSGDATSLDVKLGDAALSATRTADGWTKREAESALAALAAARVDRHQAAPAVEGDVWGTISLKVGENTEEIKFYQYSGDGGRVALDSAGGSPFVVPAAELRRLTESLTQVPTGPAEGAAGPGAAGGVGGTGMSEQDLMKMLQGAGGQ